MKKENFSFLSLLGILSAFLVGLIVFMFIGIDELQGDARVVNYSGIVRGATQRLIKNEMYGIHNDDPVAKLDDILLNLQTGQGKFNLRALKDEDYQNKLSDLIEQWGLLKQKIIENRKDPSRKKDLYLVSEDYFVLANETVFAAEIHATDVAIGIRNAEMLIVIDILLIVIFIISRTIIIIRKNRRLDGMAYIDVNTGLPNKRKCDEKLKSDQHLIKEEPVCCFMFDLNNLKQINDTMGHQWGDVLIKGFAGWLRRFCPTEMFVGRIGGDEFIGIIEGWSKQSIVEFIDRLESESSKISCGEEDMQIPVRFAYGYAYSEDYPDCSAAMLMDIADKNMYEYKVKMKAAMKNT